MNLGFFLVFVVGYGLTRGNQGSGKVPSARPRRLLKDVLKNCDCLCACGFKGKPLWKSFVDNSSE